MGVFRLRSAQKQQGHDDCAQVVVSNVYGPAIIVDEGKENAIRSPQGRSDSSEVQPKAT